MRITALRTNLSGGAGIRRRAAARRLLTIPRRTVQKEHKHAYITQTMEYARFNPAYMDVAKYFDRVEAELLAEGV